MRTTKEIYRSKTIAKRRLKYGVKVKENKRSRKPKDIL